MKIYLASDHAGFDHKAALLTYLRDELGYEVEDCGAFVLDAEDDYNTFIAKAAQAVAANPHDRAIILGGSGQGEAMQANRFTGVRSAVFYGGSLDIVRLSREHNNANVLALGARFVSMDRAKEVVKLWLETKHNPAEKYARRNHSMDVVGRQRDGAFTLMELSAILLMLGFFSAFVAASVSIARATSFFSG